MSGSGGKPRRDPSDVSQGLREQALTVPASDLGLAPGAGQSRVWGVLMETGYPEAVATLVVFADGTTSLYFSSGGGIIGAGEHLSVREASTRFLSAAEAHVARCEIAAATPLPEVGRVRFYLRTDQATLTAEAVEEELGEGGHPLSALFFAGHEVITAVRLSSEAN